MTARIEFRQIVLLVVAGLISAVVAIVFGAFLNADAFSTTIMAGIVNSVCWIVGYQLLSQRRGWISLRARFSHVGGKILLMSSASALLLIVLLSAVLECLKWIGINIATPPDIVMPTTRFQALLLVGYIVIIGPFAEELMFRGLLLDWLRLRIDVMLAALLVSLLFALSHNNSLHRGVIGWIELSDRLLIGVATSFLALRFKSLLPPFVLHATNNCVAAIFLVHSSRLL